MGGHGVCHGHAHGGGDVSPHLFVSTSQPRRQKMLIINISKILRILADNSLMVPIGLALLQIVLAVPCQGHGPVLPVHGGHPAGHVLGAGGEAVHLHR